MAPPAEISAIPWFDVRSSSQPLTIDVMSTVMKLFLSSGPTAMGGTVVATSGGRFLSVMASSSQAPVTSSTVSEPPVVTLSRKIVSDAFSMSAPVTGGSVEKSNRRKARVDGPIRSAGPAPKLEFLRRDEVKLSSVSTACTASAPRGDSRRTSTVTVVTIAALQRMSLRPFARMVPFSFNSLESVFATY